MKTRSDIYVLGDAPRSYDSRAPFDPPQRWPEFEGSLTPGRIHPNSAYVAVRELFRLAGLDSARNGTPEWNPLSDFIRPGDRVVLKPNWVRHYNPEPQGSLESVVTHSAMLRAVCDYALLATGPHGKVIVADAPQHDCDLAVLRSAAGIDVLEDHFRKAGLPVEFRDLRQEAVRFEDGVVTKRFRLAGDPEGYTEIDCGAASAFQDARFNLRRVRGADYDVEETVRHHSNGAHRYLISNTILRADCVINLPKIKTHKKAGITCCLKNLVGINGNKNYLPHYTKGFSGRRGDEFATWSLTTATRMIGVEWARKRLAAGKDVRLVRALRRVGSRVVPVQIIRAGDWHGNDTIWRTVIDLNTILQYADRDGRLQSTRYSGRTVFHLAEGIVVGGGNGPLSPVDIPGGLLVCGFDPVRIDATVAALLGFDWRKIPTLYHGMARRDRPLTDRGAVEDPFIHVQRQGAVDRVTLARCPVHVETPPHFGWAGHIERSASQEAGHAADHSG